VNNPNAKFKKKNKEMSRVQIIELSVPHKSGAVYWWEQRKPGRVSIHVGFSVPLTWEFIVFVYLTTDNV